MLHLIRLQPWATQSTLELGTKNMGKDLFQATPTGSLKTGDSPPPTCCPSTENKPTGTPTPDTDEKKAGFSRNTLLCKAYAQPLMSLVPPRRSKGTTPPRGNPQNISAKGPERSPPPQQLTGMWTKHPSSVLTLASWGTNSAQGEKVSSPWVS